MTDLKEIDMHVRRLHHAKSVMAAYLDAILPEPDLLARGDVSLVFGEPLSCMVKVLCQDPVLNKEGLHMESFLLGALEYPVYGELEGTRALEVFFGLSESQVFHLEGHCYRRDMATERIENILEGLSNQQLQNVRNRQDYDLLQLARIHELFGNGSAASGWPYPLLNA